MGWEEPNPSEELGGVTGPKYWPLFAPLVTCSVPINRPDSQLLGLTSDYLLINRPDQLMRRIGAIRIGHPPISD
jgi:hypothetical protein